MSKSIVDTKNYYDGISKGYKDLYHEEQKKKISNIIEDLNNLTGITLDLGSGDGVLNDYIENSLISLDLSLELLKLNENNSKLNATITKLPIKDSKIDNIVSLTVIQDVEDTKSIVNEIHRILKKNGTLIISFLKVSSKKELILNEIQNKFNIEKSIEEEKDIILVCKKK